MLTAQVIEVEGVTTKCLQMVCLLRGMTLSAEVVRLGKKSHAFTVNSLELVCQQVMVSTKILTLKV